MWAGIGSLCPNCMSDRRSSVGSWDGSRRRMHTDLKACGQNTALVISWSVVQVVVA